MKSNRSFYLEYDHIEWLKDKAERERRSISSMLSIILIEQIAIDKLRSDRGETPSPSKRK